MIVATGVDLVELDRVQGVLDRGRQRFLDRVFTADEAAYCVAQPDPTRSLGVRFAAKEAVMKCLGTGWAEGVGFTQIEVVRDRGGSVGVRLSGAAATVARRRGIARVHLSLSHSGDHAIAMAVAEG